jgi:hypothetical protein
MFFLSTHVFLVSIIAPTLHTHVHFNSALTKTTNERSLETFKEQRSFSYKGKMDREEHTHFFSTQSRNLNFGKMSGTCSQQGLLDVMVLSAKGGTRSAGQLNELFVFKTHIA